jgi:hypothetical protein
MASEEYEDGEGQAGGRWHGPFTWTGLLVVGWVLYELTAQPALGAVALCLKFGWEDFRTARWLRRRDPNRRRGRACFWLYTSNGLWKTAVVAFVMAFVLMITWACMPWWQVGQRARKEWLQHASMGTVLTTMAGLALSVLALARALWLAWRHRVRLWLHSAVHRACWADTWPPHEAAAGESNRLGCLLLTATLLLLLPVLLVLLYLVGLWKQAALALLLCVLLTMGLPMVVLFLGTCSSWTLWASSPVECWGVPGSTDESEGG